MNSSGVSATNAEGKVLGVFGVLAGFYQPCTLRAGGNELRVGVRRAHLYTG